MPIDSARCQSVAWKILGTRLHCIVHSYKQRWPKWHFAGSSWISDMHGSVLWELVMSDDARIHLSVCDSKQNC